MGLKEEGAVARGPGQELFLKPAGGWSPFLMHTLLCCALTLLTLAASR